MAVKHTPGPWFVDKRTGRDGEHCGWGVEPKTPIGTYRGCVASVLDAEHIGGIALDEAEANVRLIAAAPELLQALREAVTEYEGLPHSLGYEFTHINRWRELLTKATGGEE